MRKNVPKLRFPGFIEGWTELKLKDVAELINGRAYSQDELLDKGKVPVLRVGNLFTNNNWYYSDLDLDENKYIENGDLIYSWSASFGPVLWTGIRAIYHYHIWKVIVKEVIQKDFLFHWLDFDMEKIQDSTNGGTMKHITKGSMEERIITYPIKEEQTKIANFLSTLDSRITLQSQKVEKLEELKKGYMQKLFSQELRFKREDGSEYGEWEEKKLGELEDSGEVRLGRGNVIPKGEYVKGYPVYSSSVKNGGLFTYSETFMFDEELITWSIDGGGNFFHRPKHKFSVTNVSGILEVLSENINVRFLYEMLSDRHSRLTFDYLTKAHPSVIRNLYTIKLPELEEQQKIADFLSSFDKQIDMERKELEKLQELKKGLLQQMFV